PVPTEAVREPQLRDQRLDRPVGSEQVVIGLLEPYPGLDLGAGRQRSPAGAGLQDGRRMAAFHELVRGAQAQDAAAQHAVVESVVSLAEWMRYHGRDSPESSGIVLAGRDEPTRDA